MLKNQCVCPYRNNMETYELISKYLSSPIVSHRRKALKLFVQDGLLVKAALDQLGRNLDSKNFDVVIESLKAIQALSLRDAHKVSALSVKVFNLGKRSKHFEIISLCRKVLSELDNGQESSDLLASKLQPKFRAIEPTDTFYAACDYSIEYKLGNKDYKYELSNICEAFRYECGPALEQVQLFMKKLGYKEGAQYWKEVPSRWRNDFDGHHYQTSLQYYSKHALDLFVFWCIQNLASSDSEWKHFLSDRKSWDPAYPELLTKEKPDSLVFRDMNESTDSWFRKRIKKEEGYEQLDFSKEWVALYENTNFRSEGKNFDRYMATCFMDKSVKKLSKKIELAVVRYACRNAPINSLPIEINKTGHLWVEEYSHYEFLKDKFFPTYGVVNEDSTDYAVIFPAPEIVGHFDLQQKKNTLEYYKDDELVIYCLNWHGGYRTQSSSHGEDRFELANYGQTLMIKTEYLKRYMADKKLKLIARSNVTKRKVKDWGSEYDPKGSKYKWLPLEIFNP